MITNVSYCFCLSYILKTENTNMTYRKVGSRNKYIDIRGGGGIPWCSCDLVFYYRRVSLHSSYQGTDRFWGVHVALTLSLFMTMCFLLFFYRIGTRTLKHICEDLHCVFHPFLPYFNILSEKKNRFKVNDKKTLILNTSEVTTISYQS